MVYVYVELPVTALAEIGNPEAAPSSRLRINAKYQSLASVKVARPDNGAVMLTPKDTALPDPLPLPLALSFCCSARFGKVRFFPLVRRGIQAQVLPNPPAACYSRPFSAPKSLLRPHDIVTDDQDATPLNEIWSHSSSLLERPGVITHPG